MSRLTYDERFPYAPILERITTMGESISNKEAGTRLGVSERQTRNAAECGYVKDEWVADRMAIGVGSHPSEIWGYEAWVGEEDDLLELDREARISERPSNLRKVGAQAA